MFQNKHLFLILFLPTPWFYFSLILIFYTQILIIFLLNTSFYFSSNLHFIFPQIFNLLLLHCFFFANAFKTIRFILNLYSHILYSRSQVHLLILRLNSCRAFSCILIIYCFLFCTKLLFHADLIPLLIQEYNSMRTVFRHVI